MTDQRQTSGDNSVNIQLCLEQLPPDTARIFLDVLRGRSSLADIGPLRFTWSDIHDVIIAFGNHTPASIAGALSRIYDLSHIDIDEKNIINRMGADFFSHIKEKHEPYFGRIQQFLHEPSNKTLLEQYGRTADELNLKLNAPPMNSNPMETNLLLIGDGLLDAAGDTLKKHRNLVFVLLSFMYINCDLGKKT